MLTRKMNTTSVDAYLADGCGRCDLYRTPQCKVHTWTAPLIALRALLNETPLVETMKWGAPCYTLGGKNVVMLAALKGYCTLSFFKGAALEDPEGLLESPGPNSQHAMQLRFRSLDEVEARRGAAAAFVAQAIALEQAGVKTPRTTSTTALPEELQRSLDADPTLAAAFAALTPGRQRSYALHVSGAKQAETRARRAERCAPDILAGRGFNER